MSLSVSRALCAVSMFATFASTTQFAVSQPTTNVVENRDIERTSAVETKQVQLDPTYTTWFDRRLSVVEAKIDAERDAQSRLQTLLALIGIVFGILITTLVVFFALRTERTAATAATKAARDELMSARQEINQHLLAVQRVREGIDKEAGEVAERKRLAAADAEEIAKLKGNLTAAFPATQPASPDSQKIEEDSISESERDRSILELIDKNLADENWKIALESAIKAENECKNPSAILYALFAQGVSYSNLGASDLSIDIYSRVLDEYNDVTDQTDQVNLSRSQFNLGAEVEEKGDHDRAADIYSAVIERWIKDENFELVETALKSLVRRALLYYDDGEITKARGDFRRIVEAFGHRDEEMSKNVVTLAWEYLEIIDRAERATEPDRATSKPKKTPARVSKKSVPGSSD